ncbi:serine hydrolase domain-containing protein [Guptibacillus hwajinpoensis]|uniref:CubicO group peptidase (Beta-lactamase class C family) n=1 Tax=Guptibacillus hwajinpoensis TaxID=208199 RepID=A0ABU0JVM6_9BACL|nr:serine hydrolase domain-containing protein [Alkalihalobacillus hemicentroti]MDQ0481138.1 CubicO group peptidase (beta-lactamase class C family) [Alkalihalobacillus hemicentroti]
MSDHNLNKSMEEFMKKSTFSGATFVKKGDNLLIEAVSGYANRTEQIVNSVDTRFGIASGCKIFTAIAIAQLVERNVLSYTTKLSDCLDVSFPNFHEAITVHHLLTHTSGIPDYFDEDVMDDFEDLWKETPMYLLKRLKDFLPLFQENKMLETPGETFHYNNAGYILLGLIVEQQSGMTFQDYVEKHIFAHCGMTDSGYFSLDCLPRRTAIGYIDEEDGSFRTNTYSIPIIGGSDGGAYVTAPDMVRFWNGLFSYHLLNEANTKLFLHPHVSVKEGVDYGYGIWINRRNDSIVKYHVMGYDPGVCFHSAYYPQSNVTVAIPSNCSEGAFDVMKEVELQLELLPDKVK